MQYLICHDDIARLEELCRETDDAPSVPAAKISALDGVVRAARADARELAERGNGRAGEVLAVVEELAAAVDRARVRKREPVRRPTAPKRNDPCPCGNGRKYKACWGKPGCVGLPSETDR